MTEINIKHAFNLAIQYHRKNNLNEAKKDLQASLINFDADLYSSTICALNNAKDIIDADTILVFDEFLMNDRWEEDEYKALEEFCNNFNFSYDVLAISFYTKQIGIKLKKL